MSAGFAIGRRALGICDMCGLRFRLLTLKEPRVRGVRTGLRVCQSCFDPDHPQNFQGMRPVYDPQALRFTRPDVPEPQDPLVPLPTVP